MKYGIYTNQYAYTKYEQFKDLDIIDAGIMECIVNFSNSKRCERIRKDGQDYFWISHASIIKDFPMANIKTKSGIKRRIKKLEDAGLIKIHPGSKSLGRSYYQISDDYYDKLIYTPGCEGKQIEPPSHNYDHVEQLESLPPSHNYDHDYNTNNNNTNTIRERENLTLVKPLTKEQKILACNERERIFRNEVNAYDKNPKEVLEAFFNYWAERNKSKSKMKFELEKTFEISKRLITWTRNQKKFDNKGGGAKFEKKGKLEQYHNDPSLENFDIEKNIAEYNRTHKDQIKY